MTTCEAWDYDTRQKCTKQATWKYSERIGGDELVLAHYCDEHGGPVYLVRPDGEEVQLQRTPEEVA